MGGETLAILMILTFFGMLIIGIPIGIALAIPGLVFGYLGFGTLLFNLVPARIFGVVTNYTLMAVPLFVMMGVLLEKSRLIEDLLDVVGHLAGRMNGGIGVAIVLVGVVMGASTGIVGATVVTVGLLTLPAMIRRNYNKPLACGVICASGTLGQIIPPSLVLILLADILRLPVGTLFAAALMPGMVLAAIYCLYVIVLGVVAPSMAPALSHDERASLSVGAMLAKLAKVALPPLVLVVAVLGSIIGGIAAPTEAAAVGALACLAMIAVTGRLTPALLTFAVRQTLTITALVFFILIMAQIFALAFRGLGGERLVTGVMVGLPGGLEGQILFMLVVIFILGLFMEWIEISYIALPLFVPALQAAGADMVWIAILVAMNLQMSFLTPPFGWALFFLRGVAPPEVSTADIYKGVVPFIILQMAALGALFIWPQIALWLPAVIGW
jgi:tripartite ATP-independent transporter DctM subunit